MLQVCTYVFSDVNGQDFKTKTEATPGRVVSKTHYDIPCASSSADTCSSIQRGLGSADLSMKKSIPALCNRFNLFLKSMIQSPQMSTGAVYCIY